MRLVLSVICVSLIACSGSPDGPFESHEIYVSGSVMNLDNDAPIASASIILQSRGFFEGVKYVPGEVLASVKTDKNGDYLLRAVCSCRNFLNLTASADGYEDRNGIVRCRSLEQFVIFKLKPLASH